ncbi:PBS lyase HEAT domain protein repeat-containing protein [Candidatus Magnetobacterium bavaricum]|uniref:PBS lyase HEAT domain protein repeat-containing protein n=1 Tax=Candidatus Magnetobacterium bavaricum TaxID=29290 RepID=A0A0F3GHR2_9BACT|nr:PBS lyase HEAT domain protein repeat-containing protein [Candidatus Magnetobacterium bavaricum]
MLFEGIKIKKLLNSLDEASGESEEKQLYAKIAAYGRKAFPRVIDSFRHNQMRLHKVKGLLDVMCTKDLIGDVMPLLGDPQEIVRVVAKELIARKWKAEAIPYLVEYLRGSNPILRSSAVELLLAFKNPACVPKLLSMYADGDAEFKRSCLNILGTIGGDGTLKLLREAIHDKSLNIRITAMRMLGVLKDTASLDIFIHKLLEEDTYTRKAALEAIGIMGDKRAAAPVIELIKDVDILIRQAAMDILIRIGDASIVPNLIQLMKERDVNVRRAAVGVLNGIKDPKTIDVLIDAMRDSDWWVKQIATDALSEIRGENIIKFFIAMITDRDENMRRCSVEFFIKVPDKLALEALVVALDDTDWWVREKAIISLGLIQDPRAVAPLYAKMDDDYVNWHIPKALGNIGSPNVIHPLTMILGHPKRQIRLEALRAFGQMKMVDSLTNNPDALKEAGEEEVKKESLKLLKKLAQKSPDEVRMAIPQTLVNIGGADVKEILLVLLKDSNNKVRIETLKAFGELKMLDAVPVIKKCINDSNEDEDVVTEAARVLRELTGKDPHDTTIIKSVAETIPEEGTIRSEAILVIDLCNSTGIANKYGDRFALVLTRILTDVVRPMVKKQKFQFLKSTGDGFLITFPKVENAVRFAVDVLKDIGRHNKTADETQVIQLRFAINFGETTVDAKGDRLGVATNMTFRVEGVKPSDIISIAGGISKEQMPLVDRILVTETAVEEASKMEGINSRLIGLFELKGITGLHRVYEIKEGNWT